LLTGEAGLARAAIYWHFPAYLEPYNDSQWPWRTTPAGAVRCGDWKLIEFFEDQTVELYNLKEDIGEKRNLAEEMPAKVKELHDGLVAWRRKLDAPVPTTPNPEFDPESLKRQG
jgi:arylsulfatase A-like enzyme